MWDELLKLGRVGMGRVLHLGPSWHGPSFMWAELVLGRVVLHPFIPHPLLQNHQKISIINWFDAD